MRAGVFGGSHRMSAHLPYPGLRPFRRDETEIFFGREDHTDQLLDKMGETHFVAVLGTSGSGKSSLVRAGMLPALDSGLLARAGAHWSVAELSPGDRPMGRLAESLVRDTEWGRTYAAALHESADPAQGLEQDLRRGPMALNWLLGVRPLPEKARLLILVDQFEELFRYHRTGSGNDAAAFVERLLAAAEHPEVYVVITMRSDFLGDCALYTGLPEAINAGLFLTPRLTREQMADAVQFPARVFGRDVESELVNRLLDDAGGEMDQLPLLQHALMRLWEADKGFRALTLKGYSGLGGLKHALNDHAEKAYKELDAGLRPVAKVLYTALTERGSEQRDTRRPVKLGEVADLAGVKPETVARVVKVFSKTGRNFLMPSVDTSLNRDTVLDIAHEALIRQWARLQRWTSEEAEEAELYLRLEASAKRWQQGRGALWIGPDLSYALQWWDERKPFKRWAARYGGDFDLAAKFLMSSRRAARRRKSFLWGAVGAFVLVLVLVVFLQYVELVAERARRRPIEPEMKTIEPGRFIMGSLEEKNEKPLHEVIIKKSFEIGRFEVTFEEYDRFAYATGRRPPSHMAWGAGKRPVILVSWEEARDYAKWLSEKTGKRFRLPTEAEWEYAARAGSETAFSFGDDSVRLKEYGWYSGNSDGKTHPVGKKKPNAWGLYDMHGNVWEWVEDDYHNSYEGAPNDGRAWIDKPRGAERVMRGCGWRDDASDCRSANRSRDKSDYRVTRVGFRLARSIALGP